MHDLLCICACHSAWGLLFVCVLESLGRQASDSGDVALECYMNEIR